MGQKEVPLPFKQALGGRLGTQVEGGTGTFIFRTRPGGVSFFLCSAPRVRGANLKGCCE